MHRVALVVPWSGPRPWYWDLWLRSAAFLPIDVIPIEKSAAEFKAFIERRIGREISFTNGYKLCDFKPLYGVIFQELLAEYDYWAFGDCDVLYGRKLASWIDKVVEEQWDVATVRADWTSGVFTLVRNCEMCNRLYERARGLDEMMRDTRPFAFDELGERWFQRWQFGGESLPAMQHDGWSFGATCFAATDIRFLHENVLCERDLKGGHMVSLREDGKLTFDDAEIAAFHFIAAKATLGFGAVSCRDGEMASLGIDPCRRVSDAVKFAMRLLANERASWQRAIRVMKRVMGRKDWWR